jgi:hypothetical protein
MEYKGKLYGKVGEIVFPLLHTTDDWEKMENRIAQLEAENQALRQPPVSGRVCFSSDCFYNDKTLNTCVGDYDKCTVKQSDVKAKMRYNASRQFMHGKSY